MFCLYSRSDKAELVRPFLNDSFQRAVTPVSVYTQNPPYQQRIVHSFGGFYVYFSC